MTVDPVYTDIKDDPENDYFFDIPGYDGIAGRQHFHRDPIVVNASIQLIMGAKRILRSWINGVYQTSGFWTQDDVVDISDNLVLGVTLPTNADTVNMSDFGRVHAGYGQGPYGEGGYG